MANEVVSTIHKESCLYLSFLYLCLILLESISCVCYRVQFVTVPMPVSVSVVCVSQFLCPYPCQSQCLSLSVNICVSSSVCAWNSQMPACLRRDSAFHISVSISNSLPKNYFGIFLQVEYLFDIQLKLSYKPQPWNQFWSQKEPLSVCWHYKEVRIFFRYDRWPLQTTRSQFSTRRGYHSSRSQPSKHHHLRRRLSRDRVCQFLQSLKLVSF